MMAYLKINQDLLTKEAAVQLKAICPFGAIMEEEGRLRISPGCRMCRLCVKNGPEGVILWMEERDSTVIDKKGWRGIAVYVEHTFGKVHPVTLELIGKARELAAVTGHRFTAFL